MKDCITHHHACDCREKEFAEVITDLFNALMVVENAIPVSPYKEIVQGALNRARSSAVFPTTTVEG